jgi:hypothetical protein
MFVLKNTTLRTVEDTGRSMTTVLYYPLSRVPMLESARPYLGHEVLFGQVLGQSALPDKALRG